MRRRIIALVITGLFSGISLNYRAPFGSPGTQEKPKGKSKVSRKKQWKVNLRVANQRQNGLRSPIGRGR